MARCSNARSDRSVKEPTESLALRHPRALHRFVLWAAVLSALWLATAAPAFTR